MILLFSGFFFFFPAHGIAFSILTESQNHKKAEAETDIWRPCSLTTSAQEVTYSRLPNTMSRLLLNISKEELYKLSGQPLSVFSHPHSGKTFPHSSPSSSPYSCLAVPKGGLQDSTCVDLDSI